MQSKTLLIRRLREIKNAYEHYREERNEVNEYVQGRRLGLISGMVALSKSSASDEAYDYLNEVNNGLVPSEYLSRINLLIKVISADTISEALDVMDDIDDTITQSKLDILDRIKPNKPKVSDNEKNLFSKNFTEESERLALNVLKAMGEELDEFDAKQSAQTDQIKKEVNVAKIKRLGELRKRELELQTQISPYRYGENRKKDEVFHKLSKELSDVQLEMENLKNGIITDRDLAAASFVYHLLSIDSMEKIHELMDKLVHFGYRIADETRLLLQEEVDGYKRKSAREAQEAAFDEQLYQQQRQTEALEQQAKELKRQQDKAEEAARDARRAANHMCMFCAVPHCAMSGKLLTPNCGAYRPRR